MTLPIVERLRYTAEKGVFRAVAANKYASADELADTIEELVDALDPFARVVRINDAADMNSPDDKPCRDFFPGIWPTLGDCRRAAAILAKLGGDS
jgi:hypothetical protein